MGRVSENRINFTKSSLSALERRVNAGGFTKNAYVYDEASHLSLRMRPNQKFIDCSFYLYERIKAPRERVGTPYKRLIMQVGEAKNAGVAISELRQKADTLYLEIQSGRDPKLVLKQQEVKLQEGHFLKEAKRSLKAMIYGNAASKDGGAWADGFIKERRPGERYLEDIEHRCGVLLKCLYNEPLYLLTPERVKEVYLELVPRGKTQLHNAMRILRSVWNWAQVKYDDAELFVRNPVSRAMKQLGVNINRTNRRTVRLDQEDFTDYLNAVLSLRERDHTTNFRNGRDALLFMLFSGVRITGTLNILLDEINLDKKTFKIINKGGELLELPLNTVSEAIIRNRLSHLPDNNIYLYPGITGTGHYAGTSSVRRIVKEVSGVELTNHDLRRTYKTLGAELGVHPIMIDDLMGHERSGVDAHYIHPSMTTLREASQKITDHIIEKSEVDLVAELLAIW
ncbi:MAG: site-specific recombinase [SAR86 cluster bacterium]|uniref:Site-specific recombinase n=1 Tax=SAR86 cluster bacterium TaxID=2030880 RepID=A0A2A5AUD2_9GAMM|nr:MAG: site-specific recombinase [SAR86 cluster bacterium]